MWPFKRGPVEYRANYSNAAVDSLFLGATTGATEPQTTAAVETAVRALSAPYGLATVTGPAMITPAFLADLARRLFTSGNAIYRIHVINEDLSLVPASGFEVSGSSGRWVYELETPIPGNGKVDRRRVPADGTIHVRINASSSEPWRGRAPWQVTSASAEVLALIERSLKYDVMPRGGLIMPLPDGANPNTPVQLKAALTQGLGAVNLVETTNQGFGQGITAAPKEDWVQKRFGAMVPPASIQLRDSMADGIMQAFGVPPAIFSGDGNGMREARRLMFLDSILPTSALIEGELTTKLETPISISHNESEYADSQRLGRFLKSLTDAGYSLPDAANIVGLPKVDN